MNDDLYDTGSAVVGLRLFTNFLKFPGESPGLGGSIGGGEGGGGVLGITGYSPSYPSFFALLSIKTSRSPVGTIPETGKKHLIILSDS